MKRQPRREEALARFLKAVAAIPEVMTVLSEPLADGIAITTILDVEPLDSAPRSRVYAAEQELLTACPGAHVDFRLFNVREATEPVHTLVGQDAQPIYQSQSVRRAS